MTVLRWIPGAMAVLLAGICAFEVYPRIPSPEAEFHSNSDLVVLHVAVSDHKGRMIRDLPQTAFHVYEDGAPQQITLFRQEDTPVAVGLVVDNSGSMRRKLPEVVASAAAFVRSSNPQDQMFIVNFNEHVTLPFAGDFTSDPQKLNLEMTRIFARGETALYDAIVAALGNIGQSTLRRKVLVVVSDGGDNASTHQLAEAIDLLRKSDVIVYTIGLFDEYDTDRNPAVLKKLAKVSGGEAIFPAEVADVTQSLLEISRDIRNQYTIGYVPANAKADGAYRALRVTVTAPHSDRWDVRTRAGYIAPSADPNQPGAQPGAQP